MIKKRACNSPDKEEQVEGWQITYSSLALIMVVIFAMLVSYSVADKRKMGHLKEAVKGETRGEASKKMGQGGDGQESVGNEDGGAWINDVVNTLRNYGATSGLQDEVIVQRFGRGVRLKFKSDAVFASGSATVNETLYPYLDEISHIAAERDLFLKVEGHTDDTPIHTEEFPSNWELSTKRAVNIVRYFIEEKGFSAGRLSAEGFGQYRPLSMGADEEEKKQNRRIEIYIDPVDGNIAGGDDKGHEKKIR